MKFPWQKPPPDAAPDEVGTVMDAVDTLIDLLPEELNSEADLREAALLWLTMSAACLLILMMCRIVVRLAHRVIGTLDFSASTATAAQRPFVSRCPDPGASGL